MPACKEEYKTGKAPKNTQTANKEQMGMEDKDVALPKKAKKGITADTLKDKISQIKEAKKMGVEDIKSALLRRAVGIVQPLQSADTAVVKPKGRPKKYATAEEARRMKSVKTVEARKAKKVKSNGLTKQGEDELKRIYYQNFYYSKLLQVVFEDKYGIETLKKKHINKAFSTDKKIIKIDTKIEGIFKKNKIPFDPKENPRFKKKLDTDDLEEIGIIEGYVQQERSAFYSDESPDDWVFEEYDFNNKIEEIEKSLKSDEDKIKKIETSGSLTGGNVIRLVSDDEIMRGGAHTDAHQIDDYSMIINHLVEHISDPSEPVDPRDYDQAIHFIREMRRAKGGAEYYGGAVNSGNEFLDVIANTGHQMGQSHPASKFGLNPFDMGMKFGEKVVAPALMKTKLGNPHTGIFSKHFWSPKKRHGGAYTPVNSGNEFLDVIANTGHQMGQSHPASKFGLNPFDMGENLGEKLGNAMMKTKLGNPKTGIFSKKFWTPKKHH